MSTTPEKSQEELYKVKLEEIEKRDQVKQLIKEELQELSPQIETHIDNKLNNFVPKQDVQDLLITISQMDTTMNEKLEQVAGPVLRGGNGRDPHIIVVPRLEQKVEDVEKELDKDLLAKILSVGEWLVSQNSRALIRAALVAVLVYFVIWQDGCTKVLETTNKTIDLIAKVETVPDSTSRTKDAVELPFIGDTDEREGPNSPPDPIRE